MTPATCYAQGRFMPISEASVSVQDLAVQRGYGIFDFLRVSSFRPLFLEDHLDRFFASAAVMRLTIPESRERIRDIVTQLVLRNNMRDAGIRMILTGGPSPDGYQVSDPCLYIVQQQLIPPPDSLRLPGIHLCTYPFQRTLPHVKTTDYLMAIWLQPWMLGLGGDDILYHANGVLTECPRSNVFVVISGDVLATPARNMLAGVTRKKIIMLAKEAGIPVEERDIRMEELADVKEVFISSSTKRLTAVRQIDQFRVPEPGINSITHLLWRNFLALEQRLVGSE
jgi:D-alanine transaminase/branched-chain amino acid aminotransferase